MPADTDTRYAKAAAAWHELNEAIGPASLAVNTGGGDPYRLQVHVRGFIVNDAPAATLADGVRRVARGSG